LSDFIYLKKIGVDNKSFARKKKKSCGLSFEAEVDSMLTFQYFFKPSIHLEKKLKHSIYFELVFVICSGFFFKDYFAIIYFL